ncbi:hypothetical protein BDP27DRAFT_1363819 [Rhodocollybia butyracea]|uniref:Uncharacterized protein n=1 Tax=Rhodocollybia butyracea TaxID=206335 RepID=A0A9P5U7J8_9AGAR|nr:hypothetical protein BDP27DRAFT_1363819 [Rhodocollybia butyracea]
MVTLGQPQRQEFNRIFPALPNSVMPRGTLAVLNPQYNPIYTGHWIRDFIFHQKVMLDYGDKKKQAKEIARLTQMLLAHVLPKVEVFDITGVMYDPEVYEFHPPHPAIGMTPETKDVSFEFWQKEAFPT